MISDQSLHFDFLSHILIKLLLPYHLSFITINIVLRKFFSTFIVNGFKRFRRISFYFNSQFSLIFFHRIDKYFLTIILLQNTSNPSNYIHFLLISLFEYLLFLVPFISEMRQIFYMLSILSLIFFFF